MQNFHMPYVAHKLKVNHFNRNISNAKGGETVYVEVPTLVEKGSGSISGIVTEKEIPVSRRVMLYERQSGIYFGEVQSGTDGKFTFEDTVESLTYFAIALDDSEGEIPENLVGQDLLSGDFDRLAVPT